MLSESRIPKRLSDETHVLASRAQNGERGRSLAELGVTLDNYDGLRNMSDEIRYAKCIDLIAEHAPLTTIRQPVYEISKRACELLCEKMQYQNHNRRRIVLPTTLIERRSVSSRNWKV